MPKSFLVKKRTKSKFCDLGAEDDYSGELKQGKLVSNKTWLLISNAHALVGLHHRWVTSASIFSIFIFECCSNLTQVSLYFVKLP